MVLKSSSEGPCFLPDNYNTDFNISSIPSYSSEEPVDWGDIRCKDNYRPNFTSSPPCYQVEGDPTRWSWVQDNIHFGYLCSSLETITVTLVPENSSSSEGPCFLPDNYNTDFNISSIPSYSSDQPVNWGDIQCKDNYRPNFTSQSPPPCIGDQDGENTAIWSWVQEDTRQDYFCSSLRPEINMIILGDTYQGGTDTHQVGSGTHEVSATHHGVSATHHGVSDSVIGSQDGPCILPPYYTNTNFNIKTIPDSDINSNGTVDWEKIQCKDNSIKQEKKPCILIEDDENEGNSQWSWLNESSNGDIICKRKTCGVNYTGNCDNKISKSDETLCNNCDENECCEDKNNGNSGNSGNDGGDSYTCSSYFMDSSCESFFYLSNSPETTCDNPCEEGDCCSLDWFTIVLVVCIGVIIMIIVVAIISKWVKDEQPMNRLRKWGLENQLKSEMRRMEEFAARPPTPEIAQANSASVEKIRDSIATLAEKIRNPY